jgi:HK97 family phage portal protein
MNLTSLLKPRRSKANLWLASLNQLYGSTSGFGSGFGIRTNQGAPLSFQQSIQHGVKQIVWIRACLEYWATSLVSPDWKVHHKGTNTVIRDHELELLIQKPNPHMTKRDLFSVMLYSLFLAGASYTQKVLVTDQKKTTRSGTKVKELWPMRPDWVEVVTDPLQFIKGFRLVSGMESSSAPDVTFPPQEVSYMRYADPLNPYTSLSPISAAVRAIQNEDAAHTWNTALLENFAQPSGVLYTDSFVTPEQREDLKESVREQYSGANLYSPMLLTGGLKWQQTMMTHTDLQFTQGREIAKHELCAICQVPAILVGATPDPNYSNAQTARLSFLEDRLVPMLDWIAASFNNSLTPHWGDDIEIRYDLTKNTAMRKALMDKANTAKVLVSTGWPINAVNERLGLGFDPVPWGDVAWMGNVQPIDGPELDVLGGEDPNNQPDSTADSRDNPQAEDLVEGSKT